MTPFKIRWQFTTLPAPTEKRPADLWERIKRMHFEDAGRPWGYVLQGWPLGSDNAPLRLPGGQPFTYLQIEVIFRPFDEKTADATGRVPADSIKRLKATPTQTLRFPYSAVILVDEKDLDQLLEDRARFFDTIVHEIGHVLGLGTLWNPRGGPKLVRHDPTDRRRAFYVGKAGTREFALSKGMAVGTPVEIPLDTETGTSTPAYHWAEKALRFDVMSTELDMPTVGTGREVCSNVISSVSVGALKDLGYIVDLSAAQALPAG